MPETDDLTFRERLIRDAGAFCEDNGISLSRLSTIVVNDGKFFKRLEAGGDCSTGVYERFNAAFNKPVEWERMKAEAAGRSRKAA